MLKLFNMQKSIYATATLAGTIIGVGIFSLPYITLKVGIGMMFFYFFVLTALVILIHYLFGEVALKTPDFLRLPGYAQIYLGRWGRRVALFSNILGLLGAILAYIVVGGSFLTNLLSPFFGGNNLLYTILYFGAGALLILLGIRAIAKIEFWGMILFLLSLFFIFFRGFSIFNIDNLLVKTGGSGDIFLPYGPILFSLWGATLIPEVEEMLGRDKMLIRKIIPISILIPALVYLFFIFLVMGVSGLNTSPEAISGLKNSFGNEILGIMFFFGVLTTFTSFITIGLTLKKVLWYDLKIPKNLAWGIICFIPFALFLAGLKDFITIISFVGAVMLAIDGILILLMYQRIKDAGSRTITIPLILVLVFGIIYEISQFLL